MTLDKTKITDYFNETGFPFQQWCLETIRNIDKDHGAWIHLGIPEHPFTFPKSEGPTLGVHGAIDIVAVRGVEGMKKSLLFLVIECKRANKDTKNWIFLPDKHEGKPAFLFSRIISEPFMEEIVVSRETTFPELGYSYSGDFDYCYQSIEINETQTKINRNQEERIYKSLRQVNHGTCALERKIPKNLHIEGLDRAFNFTRWESFIYVPVIVTTASLFIANFNYKNIKDGNILPGVVDYQEKKWLTYEFPLPDFISYKTPEGLHLEKRTTFIVNHASLVEFLQKVGNIDFI